VAPTTIKNVALLYETGRRINPLTDSSVTLLLKNFKTLNELSLEGNKISCHGGKIIAHNLQQLTRLNLSKHSQTVGMNPIGNEGVYTVVQRLSNLVDLLVGKLHTYSGKCGLGWEGAAVIAKGLPDMEMLEIGSLIFDEDTNALGGRGFK